MGILLFPSGITELCEPKEHVFTDEEILNIFKKYKHIKSRRLVEVPNTWCVWGQNTKNDESNFNKIGSDVIKENLFCEILFIHDSQINPEWSLTDDIIYKGYEEFKEQILLYFDSIAENVIKENEKLRQQQGKDTNLIFLNTIGPTADKRVLFEFDPKQQRQEFYNNDYFVNFANKMIEFFSDKDYQETDMFYIFYDKKTVIFVKDENVDYLMQQLIEFFEKNENYENCKLLKLVLEKWKNKKEKKNKKRKTNN